MVLLKVIDTLILQNKKIQLNSLKISSECDFEADALIKQLNLQPHPEGGYYASSYQSMDRIKSTDHNKYDNEERKAGSAIFYLLKGNDFSAWHSLRSDEIWHYYKGSPIKIYILDKEGNLSTFLLGNSLEHAEASFQVVIRGGNYFAAEVLDKNAYTLVGCTVSPGFEFKDFNLIERSTLNKKFPQHHAIITQFTRETHWLDLMSNIAENKFSIKL